jgi:transposase InsO family protein
MCSRAPCWRASFPPQPQWQAITPHDARKLFRHVFERWGLPGLIQVDNGHPWGLNSGLPPDLALWLIGLGIDMNWIPPGQPQHNGKVERGNGVAQQWADPKECRSRAELKVRLERECFIQRERYPAIAGMSRLEAYPELNHPTRPYRVVDEDRLWDLARVHQFLSRTAYYRQANAKGAIWLYNRGRSLGRIYRGMEVVVNFDISSRQWIVSNNDGQELKRLPAPELSSERVLALDVGHKRRK